MFKEGEENKVGRFEKKFKEMKVEGNRKGVPAVMYTDIVSDGYSEPDCLPQTHYTKSELLN